MGDGLYLDRSLCTHCQVIHQSEHLAGGEDVPESLVTQISSQLLSWRKQEEIWSSVTCSPHTTQSLDCDCSLGAPMKRISLDIVVMSQSSEAEGGCVQFLETGYGPESLAALTKLLLAPTTSMA
jgi:hypothetical protein